MLKRRYRSLAVVFLSVLPCLSLALTPQTDPARQTSGSVVTAARMLDVRSGRMLDNVHLLIEDGRIKQIAHGKDAFILTTDMPRHDLGDVTLLPGMIDMHVHIDSDPTYSGYSYLQFNDRF